MAFWKFYYNQIKDFFWIENNQFTAESWKLKKNKYTIFLKKTLKIYSYKEFVNLINMTNKYAPKRSTSILTDCTYGNSHECIFKNW